MDAKEPNEPPDRRAGAVVLAAGRGVRMRSATPKVLHPIGGTPMVLRVIQAVHRTGIERIVVVVDAADGPVCRALPAGTAVAVQLRPGGTADATRIGIRALDPLPEKILVIGGDTPLITAQTLTALLDEVPNAAVSLGVATRDDPAGYGRVVLSPGGHVERIVEEAEASTEERALRMVNGMVFAFDGPWLTRALPCIEPAANGELYLTALVEQAVQSGEMVRAVPATDQWEVMGVNTRREQAQAEAAARQRILENLMDNGVTIVDPQTTYIDESVVVGQDVVIHPQTYLRGRTVVADGCVLGPGAEVIDSRLGPGTRVWWSVVEGAETQERVHVGPYARVRPGTSLAADVSLGSFAEVKNSEVGAGTQMHHFSYLGDAQVGPGVNIGAGAVTCNFDGENKNRTEIGAGAFVGSDTMLIAPVRVGERAITGAGSVVNRDVPAGSVVVGAPARPIESRRRPRSDSDTGRE